MRSSVFTAVTAVASLMAIAPQADAAVINSLFEETSSQGSHNDFGGVRAVVADAFGEDHRGIVEFDISSLGSFSTATLSFSLFDETGEPFDINLDTFAGDGVYDQGGDFFSLGTLVTTFSNALPVAGDILSFDVTSEVLAATNFIGFRLQRTNDPAGFFFENTADFRNFQISTDVAEPGTLAILGLGLAGLGLATRRRNAS